MRRTVIACVALLALTAVATTAFAARRNQNTAGPRGDGIWHKAYGWAGDGWYSIYGDYVGNGYSSLGAMYGRGYGGNPAYFNPQYLSPGYDRSNTTGY